jgi:hypothetical protein
MVDKHRNTQLELFSQAQGVLGPAAARRPLFVSYIRAYEKNILLTIGMLLMAIISFSLGVEKGRSSSLLKNSPRLDIAVATVPQEVPAKIQETNKEPYIIQLASYKSRASAEREAEQLKKRGFSSMVLSRGDYSVLCVGGFVTKEKAQLIISKLKVRFRDCYVRRL